MLTTTIEKCPCLAEVTVQYRTKVSMTEQPKILSSRDIETYIRHVWDADKLEHIEQSIIVMLNRANKVLGWALLSTGGLAGTVIDPKVVFQTVLAANASSFIVAHNHPSGNLEPSQADIQVTKKLQEAGKFLDLPLLDHVILTSESYYSFGDEGMLSL